MSDHDCPTPRGDAAHVLKCPACRARARVAAAWKALPAPEQEERALAPSPRFVQSVVAAVHRDRARRGRLRLALAAAAALLFFFCVGSGHETASSPLQASPEDSYVSLVSPGELAGLIPY